MIFLKFHRLVSSWILCQIDEISTFYLYSYSVEKLKFLLNNSNWMLNRRNHLSWLWFKRYFIEKFHVSLILIEFFFVWAPIRRKERRKSGFPDASSRKVAPKRDRAPAVSEKYQSMKLPKWLTDEFSRLLAGLPPLFAAATWRPGCPWNIWPTHESREMVFFPAQNISEPFASCLDDQWGGCWEVSGNISVPCVRLILF